MKKIGLFTMFLLYGMYVAGAVPAFENGFGKLTIGQLLATIEERAGENIERMKEEGFEFKSTRKGEHGAYETWKHDFIVTFPPFTLIDTEGNTIQDGQQKGEGMGIFYELSSCDSSDTSEDIEKNDNRRVRHRKIENQTLRLWRRHINLLLGKIVGIYSRLPKPESSVSSEN